MATTVDIPCPTCGQIVYCECLKGSLYDAMFFRFVRTSFQIDCGSCGFKKTYRFVSPKKLERMYSTQPRE